MQTRTLTAFLGLTSCLLIATSAGARLPEGDLKITPQEGNAILDRYETLRKGLGTSENQEQIAKELREALKKAAPGIAKELDRYSPEELKTWAREKQANLEVSCATPLSKITVEAPSGKVSEIIVMSDNAQGVINSCKRGGDTVLSVEPYVRPIRSGK